MKISSATVLYFSGTGTTEKYAKKFADALPYPATIREIPVHGQIDATMGADELLVLAAPVYGGYLPSFIWDTLASVSGNSTPAVLLAVFGARDYDNALLEMSGKLADKGFVTVGAAALVAQHSIVPSIAVGRPVDADLDGAAAFAKTIGERLEGMATIADAPAFSFKGEMGTGAAPGVVPTVSDDCIECGTCASLCPAGAIPEDEPNTTDPKLCVSCMRCIANCPTAARSVPEPVFAGASAMLAKAADPKKPNEYF